ncbi:MAG TPA: mannuronate-specific alginate lyase [Rickettsiales bacterium]|nr:mannuronate-specific alginate lyase [Rickettsiales bacterium]
MRFLYFLIALPFFSVQAYADSLHPPPGYYQPVIEKKRESFTCETPPPPFTGTLAFTSKYQGSGPSQDQLNPQAFAEYQESTKAVDDLEKGIVVMTNKYMKQGDPQRLECILSWMAAWSDAHALEQPTNDYMGKAVRKWALGSLSGAYLRLEFSRSEPLQAYPEQNKKIEAWLGRLGEQVMSDWNIDSSSSHKINNHYYWAAWAVMATSVVLNRQDMFDWSLKTYDYFTTQVDKDGYLPNELARKTRAFSYHQYALLPLSMIAAFARANNINEASRGNNAIGRVAKVVLKGMDDKSDFEAKTGIKQQTDEITHNSRQAWIPPFCYAEPCFDAVEQRLNTYGVISNTNLGGEVTTIFQQ